MTLFRIISAEKASFPVSLLCDALEVNRSSFYAWERRPPSDRALSDAWLIEQIREIWAENRKVYGTRRIHAELRLGRAINVSKKRVERLMREAGISGLIRRRRRGTTIRVPGVRVADDLVPPNSASMRFRWRSTSADPAPAWCTTATREVNPDSRDRRNTGYR